MVKSDGHENFLFPGFAECCRKTELFFLRVLPGFLLHPKRVFRGQLYNNRSASAPSFAFPVSLWQVLQVCEDDFETAHETEQGSPCPCRRAQGAWVCRASVADREVKVGRQW